MRIESARSIYATPIRPLFKGHYSQACPCKKMSVMPSVNNKDLKVDKFQKQ